MQNKKTKEFLGCQIWLEPTDSQARVDRIFQEAANSGLGWARVFLMWPMIETIPDEWDFEVFDLAFEAAVRYGIRIKATLTANSGPWHIGTPSVLHTHSGFLDVAQRNPMKRYIHACVKRYSGHPALGQWILWNEPGGGTERTDETLQHWRRWLMEKYKGNLQQLNKRWRTGFTDFNAIPFPEDSRSVDFEAGDWGLLDDMDRPTERSRMLRLLHDKLEHILPITGEWQPSKPNVWIAMDPHSQALEWVEAKTGPEVPGRMVDDGANGASLLAVCGMQCGFSTMLARTEDFPSDGSKGGMIVLSHLVALEVEAAERILAFIESGGCLLMDGTSGRKDRNAALHRPWPGGLADRIGLVAKGLDTRPEGYEVMLNGQLAGRWLLTRLEADLDPEGGWMAWPELRFTQDGEPCVWERKFGKGKIVVARGMLGPTLAHQWDDRETAKYILSKAGESLRCEIIPIPGDPVTFVVPVQTERGNLSAVFTSDRSERKGKDLFLQADFDKYRDLWTGAKVQTGPDRTIRLPAEDGVILFWREK